MIQHPLAGVDLRQGEMDAVIMPKPFVQIQAGLNLSAARCATGQGRVALDGQISKRMLSISSRSMVQPAKRKGHPLQPDWLLELLDGLRQLRLPVREVVAGDGRVRIVIAGNKGSRLEATIDPLSAQRRGWRSSRRFVLGYVGARDLGRAGDRWMNAIYSLLTRLESSFPETFAEPCGVFAPGVSPQERFLRLFPFCTVEHSEADGDRCVEVLLRTTIKCNQSCPFCSGPEIAAPGPEAVAQCIDAVDAIFPGAMLSVTGGEPTLRATFVDEVRQALALAAITKVQVQTNAVAFARKLEASELPLHERLSFFVSLHALDEAIYDRCTGTTGQLPLALAGITALIEAGHRVTLNCVVNAANIDHLRDYIRALPTSLPLGERVDLHFSTLICTELRADAPDFLVPYSHLAKELEAAAALGEDLGIQIQPLRSSTHASIPACMLIRARRVDSARRLQDVGDETGYEDYSKPWVKAARCRECSERASCLGVPRQYAEKLGLDELRPLASVS